MPANPSAAFPFTRATKVIAVADVVESVRLMELGEQDFIGRWHRFVDHVQEQMPLYSGRLHKSLGDGLMLEFSDAEGCIRAVLGMQAWFRDVNQSLPSEQQVHLRIGAHVADFVADKYDIYGTGVNVAARISSLAGPGEVVISSALRERLGRSLRLHLDDLGQCHLKHVKQPVHAYRVAQAVDAPMLPAQVLEPHGLRATVAVLPFASREGPAPNTGGHSLVDELVAGLARSDSLQVVSRISDAALDGSRETLRALLLEVGARYMLSGRPRLQAGVPGLYLELADAGTGHVIWAELFQSAASDAGSLDSRLRAQAIASVHAAVIQHEVELSAVRPLPGLEGSSLLLGAVGYMHRLSPVDVEQARRMLEHLLERWRRHPTAHAWLAHLHALRAQQAAPGFAQHDAALARAHGSAALQADPGSPLVLALDGHACVHGSRNLEAAAERFDQALSLGPQHSVALLFQAEMLAMGGQARLARAAALSARSGLVLAPLHYMYDAIAALAALADGDAEAATQQALRAVRRNPRYLSAWRTLIVAQVESNRLGEARASQQQLLRRQPAFTVRGFMGSTALHDALEARFTEALLEAGAPAS